MPPTYRRLEATSPWFPKPPHQKQLEESARLGLPVAVEHLASGYVLVLIPRSVKAEAFYFGATPVTFRTVIEATGIPGLGAARDSVYEVDEEERVELPATDLSIREIGLFLRRAGGGLELPSPEQWLSAAGFGVALSDRRCGGVWGFWSMEPQEGEPNVPSWLWWAEPYEGGKTNTAWELRRRPNRPGEYPPSILGLYDVLGNVWELCRGSAQNPAFPELVFSLKGGSWATVPEFATLDAEVEVDNTSDGLDWRDPFVGFRCCASWSRVLKGLPREV